MWIPYGNDSGLDFLIFAKSQNPINYTNPHFLNIIIMSRLLSTPVSVILIYPSSFSVYIFIFLSKEHIWPTASCQLHNHKSFTSRILCRLVKCLKWIVTVHIRVLLCFQEHCNCFTFIHYVFLGLLRNKNSLNACSRKLKISWKTAC
jgi:hypothetical protein